MSGATCSVLECNDMHGDTVWKGTTFYLHGTDQKQLDLSFSTCRHSYLAQEMAPQPPLTYRK